MHDADLMLHSERLDIPMELAPLMERVARKCKCSELEGAIKKELYTMRWVIMDLIVLHGNCHMCHFTSA